MRLTPGAASLDALAMAAMVVLCASWGGGQVEVKLAYADVPPVLQAGIRSAGAGLLVWVWMLVRGVRFAEGGQTRLPGAVAGLLFAAEFMLLFWSLAYTSAGRAVVFLYVAPFVVAIGAHVFVPGERIRAVQLVGMGLAFAGLVVLFGAEAPADLPRHLLGDVMALAAGVLWGATTVLIKASLLARTSPEKVLLYQLAISALALPVVSLAIGERVVAFPGAVSLASLAYQTVWVAFITYLVWFALVRSYSAPRLSAFTFLAPVFGTLAGTAILDEPFTAQVVVTLVLISAGIVLVNRPAPVSDG